MSAKLARKLKQARKKLRVTQKELAEQLRVNPGTLRNWEQDVSTPQGLALEAVETKLAALLAGH